MVQLRFFFENDYVAEAKTAIYWTPISKAVSIPLELGTRHGYDTFGSFLIAWKSSLELAICGTHLGETKDPTSTHLRPDSESWFIRVVLS